MTFHTARLRAWLLELNRSGHALWLLFALSFIETIFFPVPIEFILIPFMITNRNRLLATATFVTAGCLAGALFGYFVGFFLFETVGQWALKILEWEQDYESFRLLFARHGFLAILAVGITPVPFQTAVLAAGVAGYPVWKFVLATAIARGIRYYGLACLVALFAEKTQTLYQRHKISTSLILAAIIFIIWIAARLM
jgi:membrane protein YqaA with SNARE-associated domain